MNIQTQIYSIDKGNDYISTEERAITEIQTHCKQQMNALQSQESSKNYSLRTRTPKQRSDNEEIETGSL